MSWRNSPEYKAIVKETREQVLRERGWKFIESKDFPGYFFFVECPACGLRLRTNQYKRQIAHEWRKHAGRILK